MLGAKSQDLPPGLTLWAQATSQKMLMTLGAGDPLPRAPGPRGTLTSFSLLNINNFRAEKYPQVAIWCEEVGGRAG